MPQNITAVPQFTTTAPVRPLPGEEVGMETGAAPLAPLLQTLVDRDNFLWQQAHWLIAGNGEIEITATTIVLPPFGFGALNAGNTAWKHFAGNTATFPLSGTGLAGLTNVWRYVYVYDDGGPSYGIEVSATAPDDSRTWKAGTTTHRYLCPIRASGVAGQAVPMRGRAGRWTYTSVGGVVATATANGWYSLADRVPAHVRRARVAAFYARMSGGSGALSGDCAGTGVYVATAAVGDTYGAVGDAVLDASQQVSLNVGADCQVSLYVRGFDE